MCARTNDADFKFGSSQFTALTEISETSMISIAASDTYHLLYLAIHSAHKADPETWNSQHCTRVLTAVMGGRYFSWRVVGITDAALNMLHENGYRQKKGIKLTRAHLKSRAKSVQELLALPELSEEKFIEFWLENDSVVICGPGENREQMMDYHKIKNDEARLFSSNTVSWQHKQPETDYLAALRSALDR
jgi:stalled ribosome rescue protein Dom34